MQLAAGTAYVCALSTWSDTVAFCVEKDAHGALLIRRVRQAGMEKCRQATKTELQRSLAAKSLLTVCVCLLLSVCECVYECMCECMPVCDCECVCVLLPFVLRWRPWDTD